MTKLLYTCLFGNYEIPQPLINKPKGFECILFTDDPQLTAKGWDIKYIEPKDCPKKQSREVKINIHKFYNADVYVYIDANYQVLPRFTDFVNRHFKGGYLTINHIRRRCIYQEASEVVRQKRDQFDVVDRQMNQYQKEHFPTRLGLYMNGFFIRDNSFNELCEFWYNQVEQHSYRDQLSLVYSLWKFGKRVTSYNYGVINRALKLMPRISANPINVYHFVPGAADKNLGRELNKHCEIVPNDDDWILIRDNDTCFLHPFINMQLEDIIKKHGNSYEILSCMTNRLGLKYQLPYGLMKETDVLKLRDIAEKHYKEYYDEVVPCKNNEPTAGLFTLFQKKTWKKLKFEDGLANTGGFIDWRFTNGHIKLGHRIGICKGIFIFHYYRMHQNNFREYNHLV